jgi:hypothetical protein
LLRYLKLDHKYSFGLLKSIAMVQTDDELLNKTYILKQCATSQATVVLTLPPLPFVGVINVLPMSDIQSNILRKEYNKKKSRHRTVFIGHFSKQTLGWHDRRKRKKYTSNQFLT